MKQINVVAFQLKLLDSMRIHHVFYVSLLEPYHAFTIQGRIHETLPPIEIDGEQEYEVENILDSRISNRQFQYLIHWHEYVLGKGIFFLANRYVIDKTI